MDHITDLKSVDMLHCESQATALGLHVRLKNLINRMLNRKMMKLNISSRSTVKYRLVDHILDLIILSLRVISK